jgi:hypothetical protein
MAFYWKGLVIVTYLNKVWKKHLTSQKLFFPREDWCLYCIINFGMALSNKYTWWNITGSYFLAYLLTLAYGDYKPKIMHCRALITKKLAKLNMAWPKLRQKCFFLHRLLFYFLWLRLVDLWHLFKWLTWSYLLWLTLLLTGILLPNLAYVRRGQN